MSKPRGPKAGLPVVCLLLITSVSSAASVERAPVRAQVPSPGTTQTYAASQDAPTATDRQRFSALRSLADSDNPGVAQDFGSLAKTSKDPQIRRDALFNAGLVMARSAVTTWKSPPMPGPDGSPPPPTPFAQVRAQLVNASSMFRGAAREDPSDAGAARHLELVRRLIRDLDQEMERRQEQNQQRSDMAQKLEELAQQQERLAQQAEQSPSDDAEGLAQQQSALDQQTQELLERLESLDQEQQSNEREPSEMSENESHSEASQRTQDAREAQQQAQRELADQLTKPAAEAQRKAAQSLRDAAQAAREQAESNEAAEQAEESEEGDPSEQDDGDPQESENGNPTEDDASSDPTEDLLDELDDYEQENRERREAIRRSLPSRTAPVERDW
jgi:hypothetical protein